LRALLIYSRAPNEFKEIAESCCITQQGRDKREVSSNFLSSQQKLSLIVSSPGTSFVTAAALCREKLNFNGNNIAVIARSGRKRLKFVIHRRALLAIWKLNFVL
jgi:hypothetical protein